MSSNSNDTPTTGGSDTLQETQADIPHDVPTILSSSSVSTVAFEGFLLQTLLDLQTRSEVEATLNDLVTDVEFAVNLQGQLSTQTLESQAERIIAEQELALEETHVVQKERHNAQTMLADALVKDLWSLSKEVGSLLELKQKHEAMIYEYDELVAKLAQAEEDLYALRRNPQQQTITEQSQPQQLRQTVASLSQPATNPTKTGEKSPSLQQQTPKASPQLQPSATVVKIPDAPLTPSQSVKSETNHPASVKSDTSDSKQAAKPPASGETESDDKASSREKVPEQEELKAPAPVVALVEDDHDEEADPPVTLETIDMEILMRIFGFLDAYDILNTAQVNISMYSRVDSLFGFGMDAPVSDDNVSTTSTLATTPTVAAATARTPTTASVSTATTAKSGIPTTATIVKPPPQGPAASSAGVSANKQTEPQFGQRLVGGGRNIFNLLQGGIRNDGTSAVPSGQDAAAAGRQQQQPQAAKRRGARSGSDATSDNSGKPPLSEAMAHSMAAKLNDAEINAIISMTEKLRSKEKQVSLLIREKEEIEGKLNGSEAVKDFLINKVRDMEKIMNKSDETEKKVTQQIASDQEVIAFLDGRVQELERQTRVVQKEKNATQEKLKSLVAQNDKKVAVLSDMLQFERQKLKENEREWKATKKLLVKEVKGCRAQIVALQAERDGFREQNDALRKAVYAGGSGSSSSNGRSSSPHSNR